MKLSLEVIKSWKKFSHWNQPLKGKILLDRNFSNLSKVEVDFNKSTTQHNYIATEEQALGN